MLKKFGQWHVDLINSNNLFTPFAEKIIMGKMTEGNNLFVNNINQSTIEFNIIGSGLTTKVNLMERSCSCKWYDLGIIARAYAMVAL